MTDTSFIESEERRWYERRFIRVDWSQNFVTNFNFLADDDAESISPLKQDPAQETLPNADALQPLLVKWGFTRHELVDTLGIPEKVADEAAQAMDAARLQHRAHDLARELVAGEPCPVCGQEVHELPKSSVPADLKKAEKSAAEARSAHKAATEEAARIERDEAVATDRLSSLRENAAALAEALAGHPEADVLEKQLAAIGRSEKALDEARKEADAVRVSARKARAVAEDASKAVARARKTLDATRDGVAEFTPPPLSREDLAADWDELAAWARAEAARRRDAAAKALEAARAAKEQGDAMVDAQRQACIDAGIEDVTNPRDDTLKAIERTRERTAQIELALESAKEIGEMVRALEQRGVVARELGKHLKANAFERWVLRQALEGQRIRALGPSPSPHDAGRRCDGDHARAVVGPVLAHARQAVQLRRRGPSQRRCDTVRAHALRW